MLRKRTSRMAAFIMALILSMTMLSGSVLAAERLDDGAVSDMQSCADGTDETDNIETEEEQSDDVQTEEEQPDDGQAEEEPAVLPTENLVVYSGYSREIGDLSFVMDGTLLGTTGQARSLEAIRISKGDNLSDMEGSIVYRVHGQTYGTQNWVSDGSLAGTTGQSKRLEAVQIYLTGELAEHYDVYYRSHIQTFGWLQWVKGGSAEDCWSGSTGLAKRLEGLQIVLVPKDENGDSMAPSSDTGGIISVSSYGYVTKDAGKTVVYSGHQQTYGNLSDQADGASLGTTGQSKRLEAVSIRKGQNLSGVEGSIQYRVHIQNDGTQGWVSDGALAGTTGQSKRIEAIQIRLTGELSEQYDIYYSVHVQKYGWTKWTKGLNEDDSADGVDGWCGTNGLSLRIESIQIVLVEKGVDAPTNSGAWSYLTRSDMGSIVYSGHQQTYGDISAVANGATLGTTGESKRMEAISISLSGGIVSGSVQYRTNIASSGWQDWISNGALSGTTGQSKQIESIQIKLSGNIANYCDVWYRVHVEKYGWLGWAKNGQTAGTSGISYRVEAIEIRIVPINGTAPGTNSGYYTETPKMSASEQRIYNSVVSVYNSVGRDLYACYQWVVNNMTYERINGHLTPPSGYTRCQWYAVKAFETHQGNCYCYAAAFYYLAKYLGYDAEYVEGQVTKRGGGYTPHGWVVINGSYICDPEAQAEISRSLNFYMQPINSTLLTYVR